MKTAQRTFTDFNILTCEIGTTGFMGGDAGHGGKTYVKITDDGATCWSITIIDDKGRKIVIDQPRSIIITVLGDAELRTLTECLQWAGKEMKKLSS